SYKDILIRLCKQNLVGVGDLVPNDGTDCSSNTKNNAPSPDGRGLEPPRAEGDWNRRKGEGSRRKSAEGRGLPCMLRLTPTETSAPHPFAQERSLALSCAQALSRREREEPMPQQASSAARSRSGRRASADA